MSGQRPHKTKRAFERRANNLRAAWNRIAESFNLRKEDLDYAKRCQLNPYKILRHRDSYTAESVRAYILNDGLELKKYESMAEYLVDREIYRLTEIARLEQEGLHRQKILDRVGEHWW
jgi:hypothetical protein